MTTASAATAIAAAIAVVDALHGDRAAEVIAEAVDKASRERDRLKDPYRPGWPASGWPVVSTSAATANRAAAMLVQLGAAERRAAIAPAGPATMKTKIAMRGVGVGPYES